MPTLFVVDGNSLLFRAFYATMHGGGPMATKDGTPTNAIFAFSRMMSTILSSLKEGDYLFVAFDADSDTFRKEELQSYKANRAPCPEELKPQFPISREFLSSIGAFYCELHGYEADDLAGTVTLWGEKAGLPVEVYTSDKDYLQLVSEHVHLNLLKVGMSQIQKVTPENIVELLNDLEGVRGLRRARHAASLVQSGAGSPEETLLSLAFKLPESLGGIEAPPFLENEPIDWPEEVRHLIEHGQMRPDFNWPGHLTAGEYNGKDHISEEAFEEDQRRIRDYQRCGISVFPASYKNVRTVHALNGYLASVAHSLAKTEGPEFEARVRRALEDEGATHARRVLLSQTLPAIPSEKPCW